MVPLDFNLDVIMRGFTDNPSCFFYPYHFTIAQLIVELKEFIVAGYFHFTTDKISGNVKLELKIVNNYLNRMQKQVLDRKWSRNINNPMSLKYDFSCITVRVSEQLNLLNTFT